ncbi:SARP family transcriptional regulator [Streptomyces pimonensis]|uniref:SARP family transcriptional regulator n=1 Tax=Streptomyces pimonensis TaxID=2860288 RepID=A0ABV4IXM8_9ACTN
MHPPPACQRLLAYLALQHDPAPRTRTAHTLWPDIDDAHAAACLRSTLHRLPRTAYGPLVEHPAGALALAGTVSVDTRHLERQAATVTSLDEVGPTELPTPDDLCHDLLPDWNDDWLLASREWLRQLRLRTLERLAARHCRAGRLDDALEAAMSAVACEPLRESAHRMVAAVHLADGNSFEALRQYDLYRHLLRDELGLSPSPRFRHLLADVLGRPVDASSRTGDAPLAQQQT